LDHNADDVYATFFYKGKIILQTRSCTIVRDAQSGAEHFRVRREQNEFNTESFLHKNELIIKVYAFSDYCLNDAYHYVLAINLENGCTRELINLNTQREERLINRLIITGDRLIAKIGQDKIACWDMQGHRIFGFRIGDKLKNDLNSRLFAAGTKIIYVNGAHITILNYETATETNLTLAGKTNVCCLHRGTLICGMADSARLIKIDLNNECIARNIDLPAEYVMEDCHLFPDIQALGASKKILSVCSQKHSIFFCTDTAVFRLNSKNWSLSMLSAHHGKAFRSLELHAGCVVLHSEKDKNHEFDVWRVDNLVKVGELTTPEVVHTYAVHDMAWMLATNKGVTRVDFDMEPTIEKRTSAAPKF
jgi:hypothetical protein